jgi:hypothetical protein
VLCRGKRGNVPHPRRDKGSKYFFFEKKKQKTLSMSNAPQQQGYAQRVKVFWFFFSKKNCFLPLAAANIFYASIS